jgi:hypothetical protein
MSLHPVNLAMKCETNEGFQCQLKNSSSDSHKGSSELGSGHTETESGRTDAAQVSSGIVCIGFSKDSFLISVPQSNNEANIHGLIKAVECFQSTMLIFVHKGLHLKQGINSGLIVFKMLCIETIMKNILQNHTLKCALNLLHQKQKCFPLWMKSNFQRMIIVLKIVLFIKMTVNTAIVNDDYDNVGVTDYKVEGKYLLSNGRHSKRLFKKERYGILVFLMKNLMELWSLLMLPSWKVYQRSSVYKTVTVF